MFFRVFASQSADTDYDPNGTYASHPDTAGKPGTPMPGPGDTTMPFFATGNAGSETDYQSGGPNIHTLTIPSGQDDLWWYYGCFLNFYDPANQIDGQQVQALLPGTHHCVVAQIAYDDAPIPTGVSPLSWDQLAQRNLQFTADRQSRARRRRIARRRPSTPGRAGRSASPDGDGLPPDELMIDWGDDPAGVDRVDLLAGRRGCRCDRSWRGRGAARIGLSSSDAHTLTLKVEGGVSYVPIPAGAGQNFAGLLTVEVPPGIRPDRSSRSSCGGSRPSSEASPPRRRRRFSCSAAAVKRPGRRPPRPWTQR